MNIVDFMSPNVSSVVCRSSDVFHGTVRRERQRRSVVSVLDVPLTHIDCSCCRLRSVCTLYVIFHSTIISAFEELVVDDAPQLFRGKNISIHVSSQQS
jgi:hypothetical protein